MRLLHTSDWHLGMTFRSGTSYCKDQEFFIEDIINVALNERVDGIIIAGDVFDKSIASNEALSLYDQTMTRICAELNIPVFIVAGNHDGARRLSQCNELLKKSGLYVAGALQKEAQMVSMGDVDIYMLPWISTDKVRSIFPDEADDVDSIEDAYKLVLDKYRAGFNLEHKNILIAHAFIVNAITSVSDRAAEVGRATMVSSKVFEGFDYVALGHLHGPQDVNEHIRYSGTPMIYSFGREESQIKSVTIYDTDTSEKKIVPINNLYRRTTLKGKYEELIKADYDEDIVDGYVRLEVTDSYVGLETISAFREKYKNLLEISGKSLEKDDAKITMTIDELEEADNNPSSIFERYCEDILEAAPSKHLSEMFLRALESYEKEVTEE